ncbi:MAG TPA: hypothetical protein DEP72_06810 [Clostridiales bacterium]|nr:MAG: hypothetical protein A2Y18_06200 [Clostridiales bacterium GWD2_32_19]HCC07850.1 hypothetical protein [Clostridiales bacterium]
MRKIAGINLLWKIFSVILAIVLWFIVINIQNPIETLTVKNIPIKLTNMEKVDKNNLLVTNKGTDMVKVKFRGNRLALERLRKNISRISASVDMQNYTKVGAQNPNSMQIQIELPIEFKEYIKVEQKDPQYVQVILEENKEISKVIELEFKNNVKDGYEVLKDKIKMKPSEVIVDGASSDINSIDKVKAEVNMGGLHKTLKTNVLIKFYDINKNEIMGLRANANVTNVEIPIVKNKTITFKTELLNELRKPLILESIILSPSEVLVTGEEDVIDKLDSIWSIPLDLSNITQSQIIEQEIVFPEGVMNSQKIGFITINVNVKK